jgi:hypothetical protein
MRRGLYAGLIAGAIAGVIPFIVYQIYSAIGILEPKIYTIMFLVRQVIIHIGINALWGVIFGIIFALFFDRIPGKGIMKGIWIGAVYSLFSVIRPTLFVVAYGFFIWGIAFMLSASLEKFVYGILFTKFYKEVT